MRNNILSFWSMLRKVLERPKYHNITGSTACYYQSQVLPKRTVLLSHRIFFVVVKQGGKVRVGKGRPNPQACGRVPLQYLARVPVLDQGLVDQFPKPVLLGLIHDVRNLVPLLLGLLRKHLGFRKGVAWAQVFAHPGVLKDFRDIDSALRVEVQHPIQEVLHLVGELGIAPSGGPEVLRVTLVRRLYVPQHSLQVALVRVKREPAAQHRVQNHSGAPDVCLDRVVPVGVVLRIQDLGRHVGGGAHDRVAVLVLVVVGPAQAKVADFHARRPAVVQKNVRQLQVPVRDVALVAVVHRGQHLLEDVPRLFLRHGLVLAHRLDLLGDVLEEVPTGGVLHEDAKVGVCEKNLV
mmetsp:Transcript_2097/g.5700  ORF Transcript_2097/g.5700 Transcript_2097/m.5700 type:complete len:349 (-) Transcript_2097:564-1610(-)